MQFASAIADGFIQSAPLTADVYRSKCNRRSRL